MSRPRKRERLRYWFDNTMSKGPAALIGWLAVASLLLVMVVTALAVPAAEDPATGRPIPWYEVLWRVFLRSMDPGTMAGDRGSPWFVAMMLAVTLGGLFIVAALVGILTTGLEAKLESLRKGRSRVIESGHTVVLGWSEQIFTVISELVEAKESESRPRVAILADKDKVEMEDEIRARLGSTGKIRVVCRSGSPTEPVDLEIVSPDDAHSIIVLSPETDEPDTHVVKTLLALSGRPWRRDRPHIVAAVEDTKNLAAARLAGGPYASVVDADDMAARLLVQSCRQAGLSIVTTDLLDFDGDEMYMHAEPRLAGLRYGEALFAYGTATVVGLLHGNGRVSLNPPMNTRITPDDQMIVIAEDDSTIALADRPPRVAVHGVAQPEYRMSAPERILLLGWNKRAAKMIKELDEYVVRGSAMQIAARRPQPPVVRTLPAALRNLAIDYKAVDTADREHLGALNVPAYDQVIALADDDLPPEHADSRTLVTLLHLRDMETRMGARLSIVSEMHDERNRKLAQITKADDFVVGGKMISLLLTQLSENLHLAKVFAQLFTADGSEIYLKPAQDYVVFGRRINFATVIYAARQRNETAIGYRLRARSGEPPSYGVVLNPDKNEAVTFGPGDRVVVLAED